MVSGSKSGAKNAAKSRKLQVSSSQQVQMNQRFGLFHELIVR